MVVSMHVVWYECVFPFLCLFSKLRGHEVDESNLVDSGIEKGKKFMQV